MLITILAGGVGGSRFTRALRSHLAETGVNADITVIANTGDDFWLNGLRVCPDLDTMMYTLGGGIAEDQGWGRETESSRVAGELAAYGVSRSWFTLGDLDIGTHIVRSQLLREGRTLSEATEFLNRRWKPGVTLLPMSDQPVETHVRVSGLLEAPELTEGRAALDPAGHFADLLHFEEWWVKYRAGLPATEFVQLGLDRAAAAPGVLEAILGADLVILPPSNPVVSVGTILAVPGVRDALRATSARVVGVSPIIDGAAVRGMADACLSAIGVETSARAVAEHYGSRSVGGLLDVWLVDSSDEASVPPLRAQGFEARAIPLWMSSAEAARELAAQAIAAVA